MTQIAAKRGNPMLLRRNDLLRICMLALAPAFATLTLAPAPAAAQVAFGVSVNVMPPALPVYAQPPLPGPGYIWTPGIGHGTRLPAIITGCPASGRCRRASAAVDPRLLGMGQWRVSVSRRLLGADGRFLWRSQLRLRLYGRRLFRWPMARGAIFLQFIRQQCPQCQCDERLQPDRRRQPGTAPRTSFNGGPTASPRGRRPRNWRSPERRISRRRPRKCSTSTSPRPIRTAHFRPTTACPRIRSARPIGPAGAHPGALEEAGIRGCRRVTRPRGASRGNGSRGRASSTRCAPPAIPAPCSLGTRVPAACVPPLWAVACDQAPHGSGADDGASAAASYGDDAPRPPSGPAPRRLPRPALSLTFRV